MTKILSKADFKTAERRRVEVEIPEFGGVVYFQSLTAREKSLHDMQMVDRNTLKMKEIAGRIKELTIIATCVNDQGEKLFTIADLDFLGSMDSSLIDRLYVSASSVAEPPKPVEEHEKN